MIHLHSVCRWFCSTLDIQQRLGSIDSALKVGHTCSLGRTSSRSGATSSLHQLVYQPSSSACKTLLWSSDLYSTVPVHACVFPHLPVSTTPILTQFSPQTHTWTTEALVHKVRIIVEPGNLETLPVIEGGARHCWVCWTVSGLCWLRLKTTTTEYNSIFLIFSSVALQPLAPCQSTLVVLRITWTALIMQRISLHLSVEVMLGFVWFYYQCVVDRWPPLIMGEAAV